MADEKRLFLSYSTADEFLAREIAELIEGVSRGAVKVNLAPDHVRILGRIGANVLGAS